MNRTGETRIFEISRIKTYALIFHLKIPHSVRAFY